MTNPRLFSLLGLALLALVSACEDPDSRAAEWETIHASIVVPSCATSSCHSSFSMAGGLIFEDVDDTYEFLVVQEGFVIPFEPDRSVLMDRLNGDDTGLMPPDGSLPKADVDWIQRWIEEGALR